MSDSRPPFQVLRRIGPLGAITATAVLGAGLLGVANLVRDDDRPQPEFHAAPLSSPSPIPTATASVAPVDPASLIPGGGAGEPVRIAKAPVSVRYTFDAGPDQPVTDTGGQHPLQVSADAGGSLSFAPVRPVGGFAVQFPPRCKADPVICPRAILEGVRDDTLNPGTRPLRYGASVLMTPADTGDGANVVQKGYSVGGESQFKLQVDHATAYPSCVIAGTRIHRIEPPVSIADGTWHSIVCSRTGGRLGISVDGVHRGSVALSPRLSIANAEPLRIGGKGSGVGNDQFAGQIDDVFLTIA